MCGRPGRPASRAAAPAGPGGCLTDSPLPTCSSSLMSAIVRSEGYLNPSFLPVQHRADRTAAQQNRGDVTVEILYSGATAALHQHLLQNSGLFAPVVPAT